MDLIDCEGIWWIPAAESEEAERVVGRLRLSSDAGVTLSLAGSFGAPPSDLEDKQFPIVLGVVWDCEIGKVITVRNCRLIGLRTSVPGIAREQYSAERLLVNQHLDSDADFAFTKATLEFLNLGSWARRFTGFLRKDGFRVEWEPRDPITSEVVGGRLTMGVGANSSESARRAVVEERVQLVVDLAEAAPIESLLERFVTPLENLVTLATDRPSALRRITVQQQGEREPIIVLDSQAKPVADDVDLADYKMLFSLADLGEDNVGRMFSKWLDVSSRLKAVCDPYFAIHRKPDSYLELQFLAAFQAIEIYQRIRVGSNHDVPDSESLRHRVREVLAQHWAVVGPLFHDSLDSGVNAILAVRNYVVHRVPDFAMPSNHARELFWLTQKVMFVMKAVFLLELGIAEPERRKLILRNQMYTRILRASQASSPNE